MPIRVSLLSSLLICGVLAAAQVPAGRVRVSENVMRGLLIRKVVPTLPDAGVHVEGGVVLRAWIDKTGVVAGLQVVSSHPLLVPSAIDAAKQWTYKPYLLNGKPIEGETTIHVKFSQAATAQGTVGDAPGGLPPEENGTGLTPPCEGNQGALRPRLRVLQSVMQNLLVKRVKPEYPENAKRQHIEGTVLLGVELDKEGSVCNFALISSHPLLAPAAIDAVKQWKYKPYLLNAQPVEVETGVQVTFTLAGLRIAPAGADAVACPERSRRVRPAMRSEPRMKASAATCSFFDFGGLRTYHRLFSEI